tara:strand:- start:8480 stop:9238 length:759 start_codon:yes stop_codon:yes gene_type:complete
VKKHLLVILVLLLAGLSGFGQDKNLAKDIYIKPVPEPPEFKGVEETEVIEQIDSNNYKQKLIINFAPLSIIDVYSGPSYRFGVEAKINNHFSINIEGGGYFQNFTKMRNIKGVVTKSELKYYVEDIFHERFLERLYISAEFFYKNQSYNYTDSISISKDTPNYQKQYTITKFISAWSVKVGYMQIFKNRFVFEYFAGLGRRDKNVDCTLTDDEYNNITYGEADASFERQSNRCGKQITLNLIWGFKLGYVIF